MTTARCGTVSGYAAHRRRGEMTCQECRDAKAAYGRARDQRAGTCQQASCGRPVRARGWCGTHLSRVRRHGTVADPVQLTAAEKFWPNVTVGPVPVFAPELGPCLLWTGAVGSRGYGKFSVRRGELWQAHRWLWVAEVGPIPGETPELDHLCRVRICVRTRHLEPVTRAENLRREHQARRAAA
ncbi:MAG TPA: HNH endonuclease signature motif containing protein [Egibacteraceae bacterium]|jgi:hypothetical protein|nr:HNH endonuclease signature motif containing protein [Egibacteraceae bacterium]